MPIRAPLNIVLEEWQQLNRQADCDDHQLRQFVEKHFDAPGMDLEAAELAGWNTEGPAFLHSVMPAELSAFGLEVHKLWRVLHRKVAQEAAAQPERHTLLPLPNPFVIPGDRFREVYYWDSYWIIVGLLACGLCDTATGMVDNLLSLVEAYGFVPNGSRTYYLNRSQPPLLSAMVAASYGASGSEALLRRSLTQLLRTWDYWTAPTTAGAAAARAAEATQGGKEAGGGPEGAGPACGKAVLVMGPSGRVHRLSRYCADWDEPRPESYREDLALASGLQSEADRRHLYRDLASAAESGWDFSSRWFADGGGLGSIRTTQVIPADLNALLYLTARHISEFAATLGDRATSAAFERHASDLALAMEDLMWCQESGCWHDLLLAGPVLDSETDPAAQAAPPGPNPLSLQQPRGEQPRQEGPGTAAVVFWHAEQLRRTYASNWVPLWCGCCEPGGSTAQAAVRGLAMSGLIREAGIATSLYETGEQWDSPNAWPPLQHMLISGLQGSGVAEGEALAAGAASAWIRACHVAYRRSGHMHEKYDVGRAGKAGGGGEYVPQVGFGWSNGVLLDLLRMYPNQEGQQLPASNT